jgi:hypothetical protein
MQSVCILFTGQMRTNPLSNESLTTTVISDSIKKDILNDEFKSKFNYDVYISSDSLNLDATKEFFGDNLRNIYLQDTLGQEWYLHSIESQIPPIKHFLDLYDSYDLDGNESFKYQVYQFYRALCCFNLVDGFMNYDYIILLRPDLLYNSDFTSKLDFLNKNEDCHLVGNLNYYAVGRPEIMKHYCELVYKFGSYNKNIIKYDINVPNICTPEFFNDPDTKRWTFSPEIQLACHLYEFCKMNNLKVDTALSGVCNNQDLLIVRHWMIDSCNKCYICSSGLAEKDQLYRLFKAEVSDRASCLICNTESSLANIFTLKDYPITPSSSQLDPSTDEFKDCIIATCRICDSVQLKTLIDAEKLYKNSHNMTYNTPTWKRHHLSFSEFVSNNSDSNKTIEVGGSNGILYTLLNHKKLDYTILDICKPDDYSSDATFLQGNCETFDFSGYANVILSHTFEHLYSPRKFIERLSIAQVTDVYISIPNMTHLYETKNISIIHNEHTFFITSSELDYMFSLYNYRNVLESKFENHSIFYKFTYDTHVDKLCLIKNENLQSDYIRDIFTNVEKKFKDIIVNTKCFICPAGHYGQKIYYYMQHYSNYIQGFLDNDSTKQNKRVYGTPNYVFSPDILSTYLSDNVTVILYAGVYTEELKTQLNKIHPNITYICI